MDAIVLIGFMGSGKTTLGRALATRLGRTFVDLDQEIEAHAGRSVRDLFATEGEAVFRAVELQSLERLHRNTGASLVLATGGGVVETPVARDLLGACGTVVWLRADPQACIERLGTGRRTRPLLDAPTEWRRRWQHRLPLYHQLATIVVDTHPQSVDESLAQLLSLLPPTLSPPRRPAAPRRRD